MENAVLTFGQLWRLDVTEELHGLPIPVKMNAIPVGSRTAFR
jgi:hypothetical protein